MDRNNILHNLEILQGMLYTGVSVKDDRDLHHMKSLLHNSIQLISSYKKHKFKDVTLVIVNMKYIELLILYKIKHSDGKDITDEKEILNLLKQNQEILSNLITKTYF